jgi:hypothetical protein
VANLPEISIEVQESGTLIGPIKLTFRQKIQFDSKIGIIPPAGKVGSRNGSCEMERKPRKKN